jgi:hypothetical protein
MKRTRLNQEELQKQGLMGINLVVFDRLSVLVYYQQLTMHEGFPRSGFLKGISVYHRDTCNCTAVMWDALKE